MPVPTPFSPTVGPAEGVSVFGGQGVGLQRSGCRFGAAYASHLADVEEQAQDLFSRLVKEYTKKEGITEQLKATDQMKWVQKMNNLRERVIEIVYSDVVFV